MVSSLDSMRGIVQVYSELHPIGLGPRHSQRVPLAPIALSPPIDRPALCRCSSDRELKAGMVWYPPIKYVSYPVMLLIYHPSPARPVRKTQKGSPASFEAVNTGPPLIITVSQSAKQILRIAGQRKSEARNALPNQCKEHEPDTGSCSLAHQGHASAFDDQNPGIKLLHSSYNARYRSFDAKHEPVF